MYIPPPPVSPPQGRVWEGPRVWEGFLLQNQINQGGNVAHVDFAVAVDVAHGVGVGAAAEDFVDEGGYIAHVHFAIAIDVACDLRVEVNINMSNTAGLEAR